jgi:hypothetical protein
MMHWQALALVYTMSLVHAAKASFDDDSSISRKVLSYHSFAHTPEICSGQKPPFWVV